MEKAKGEIWLIAKKKDDRKQKSIENRKMRGKKKKKRKVDLDVMNPQENFQCPGSC